MTEEIGTNKPYRRWRARHSYPPPVVGLACALMPHFGAPRVSRLLDIPTSVIYRWRAKFSVDVAATSSIDTETLEPLIVRVRELGFQIPDFMLPEGKKVLIASGDLSRAADWTPVPSALPPPGLDPQRKSRERPSREVSRRLEAARKVIETEYFQEINCQELADVAQMSLHHFVRMFRERYGTSPYQYLTRTRISAAKRLLRETREPIEVIAAGTGFQSGSSLNRAFRQQEGICISRYCHDMQRSTGSWRKPQLTGEST